MPSLSATEMGSEVRGNKFDRAEELEQNNGFRRYTPEMRRSIRSLDRLLDQIVAFWKSGPRMPVSRVVGEPSGRAREDIRVVKAEVQDTAQRAAGIRAGSLRKPGGTCSDPYSSASEPSGRDADARGCWECE